MKRTNLLNQFFQSKSDANEFLEANNQESLEKSFQEYMTNDRGELDALDFVNEMCISSLSPDAFEEWEKIKKQLKESRRLLKKFDYSL